MAQHRPPDGSAYQKALTATDLTTLPTERSTAAKTDCAGVPV